MTSKIFLCQIIGINPTKFSKEENTIIEAELFVRICEEIKDYLKNQHKDYFRLIKFDIEKENEMIEENLAQYVINDILGTEEYTLSGIACYTQTPEDVIYELATGSNVRPSAYLMRKIIELHRTVRKDLYINILKKITSQCSIAG